MFFDSTDLMSSEHTSRIITPLLRWFDPGISDEMVAQVHLIVRKLAHILEYAVLASLLLRALRNLMANFRYRVAFAFIGALLFAVTDEFHQSFVHSRTSSLGDVGIDCAGAILGILACLMRYLTARGAKRGREERA
jgi:VanZ family protein